MKILFVVPPWTGHVNPTVSVARRLAANGHEVAWAGHAGGNGWPAAIVFDVRARCFGIYQFQYVVGVIIGKKNPPK